VQQHISTIRPRQASALPRPRFERYGTASFHTADVLLLAAWLEQAGWQEAELKNPATEYARFWLGVQLLVLFQNGTVLAQGLEIPKTLVLLAELVGGAE
jgi:hypothetical protein